MSPMPISTSIPFSPTEANARPDTLLPGHSPRSGAIEPTQPIDPKAVEQTGETAEGKAAADSLKGPLRGRVFALKDGSGFAIQGNDGAFYRVDATGSNGMVSASGYVDSAMVNVASGPVGRIPAPPDTPTPWLPGDKTGGQPEIASAPRTDKDPSASPLPPIKDATHASDTSREAQALMQAAPDAAILSQANLDPASVLSLLH